MSKYEDIPMGLGMALVQNPKAMRCFASLSPSERRNIIEHTHGINSPAEMKRYVQSLASMGEEDLR